MLIEMKQASFSQLHPHHEFGRVNAFKLRVFMGAKGAAASAELFGAVSVSPEGATGILRLETGLGVLMVKQGHGSG